MGYSFESLFDTSVYPALAEHFYKYFEEKNPVMYCEFAGYRDSQGEGYTPLQVSEVLIGAAPYLSSFIGELFMIEGPLNIYIEQARNENEVFRFKKDIIQRKVFKRFKPDALASMDRAMLSAFAAKVKADAFPELDFINDEELSTAKLMLELSEIEKNYRWFYKGDKFAPENFTIPNNVKLKGSFILSRLEEEFTAPEVSDDEKLKFILETLEAWLFAKYHYEGYVKHWASYFEPKKTDYNNLVEFERPDENFPELLDSKSGHFRQRNGFKLNDHLRTEREVLNQVDYCMLCHDRNKDSCSKGMTDKAGNKQVNPVGNVLNGCPLNEKISESHTLRKAGYPLASLSVIMIDNPMCPGTGHRICNDCMKGCIFQKQEPVNIPLVESSILREVLALPYGFEIYSLLTRWNPLNIHNPYEKPYNGKNVLVVGMGPAGYTLAHHLLKMGFGVAGIDALKIEPLFSEYTGANGEAPRAVKDFHLEIYHSLDERILQGFGGVSEYGITVRWDKNFLSVIYIALMRRNLFRLYDGVRFGSTITIEDAWSMGFDHIGIASGAGSPTIINAKNNLAKGVKKSSDFLMMLQLSGAQKDNNLAVIQMQLPAVVIGGGLTGIDCSTELLAYYPVHVEKILSAYEKVVNLSGDDAFWQQYNEEEKDIIKNYLMHAYTLRTEYQKARMEQREPRITELLRSWGGVTFVYRKSIHDAPSYRENHEEIVEALEQGIRIAERLSPAEFITNKFGSVQEAKFNLQEMVKDESGKTKYINSDKFVTLPARTVIVAAGTSPNISYEKEYPGTFKLDRWNQFFLSFKAERNENGIALTEATDNEAGFFTSYLKDNKTISFFGDNHPVYVGNVVRAMASAKEGSERIYELFKPELEKSASPEKFIELAALLDAKLSSRVVSVNIINNDYTSLVINAPMNAAKYEPGQFYKLQNYELYAPSLDGTKLVLKPLALAPLDVNKETGDITFIIHNKGVSSKMISFLKPGEKVMLMGPAGAPFDIPSGQKALFISEGYRVYNMMPAAKAFKEKNEVTFIAINGPDKAEGYPFEIINIPAGSPAAFVELLNTRIRLDEYDTIIIDTGSAVMSFIKDFISRHSPSFFDMKRVIGVINSPMQCMMKEVCADCLQKQMDLVTGKETFVYSCVNQNQELRLVDLNNYEERLKFDSAAQRLNENYLDLLLSKVNSTA
jgi:NADPH-dependent glutamate synthase beta subunit-like oxidoreductase